MTKMLTAQEIFDKAVGGIIKQGKASGVHISNGNVSCKYRLDNLKCAAGMLIDDGHYSLSLEGCSANGRLVQKALLESGVSFKYNGLVNSLQNAHDLNSRLPTGYFVESFKRDAKAVADEFKLEWNFE